MKPIASFFLASQFLFAGSAFAAANETEMIYTLQDIQAVIDKVPKSKAVLDGLLLLSLEESPVIKLGDSPNRFDVSARLAVGLAGAKPVSVTISASSSLIYDESRKAFFLRAPIVESLDAAFIPKALEDATRNLITSQLLKRFSAAPIYTLRENGPRKERTAWQQLKSIQIRRDAVVAKFALK